MDIGIIISTLLQIGFGAVMVILIGNRIKKTYTGRHPRFWKTGAYVGLIWGWIMIVLSTYNLLVYLFVE
jgi:hypothetical protein